MKYFFPIFYFGSILSCFGQPRTIVGRVLSAEDQKPIKNANVVILGSTLGAVTNHLGFFSLELENNDSKAIVISHIGFQTSRVELPESNSFKVLLEREYINFEPFDLAFFRELSLPPIPVDSLESKDISQNNHSIVELDAMYPGGFDYFFNDLGKRLVDDSIFHAGMDSLVVQFCIDEEGKTNEIVILNDTSIQLEYIKEVLSSVNKWMPALQRNNPVGQYFTLPIKWSEEIFTIVENPARPVGSMSQFYSKIGDEIKYPPEARRLGIEGRVFVQFTIESDGSITNPTVVKGIGGGCDEEAIRVIMSSGKWIPGNQEGAPVAQQMVLPITFKLGPAMYKSATKFIYRETEIDYNFDNLYEFLSNNINYPAPARSSGIEGFVVVEFKIDSIKYSISNINLLKDIGESCGFEVMRVLEKVPTELLKKVRTEKTWYVLPVGFGFELPPTRGRDDIVTEAELLEDVYIIAKGINRKKTNSWNEFVHTGGPSTIMPFANQTIFTTFESAFLSEKKVVAVSIPKSGIESIPHEIGKLIFLEFLDLESNQISLLPDEIGLLERLGQMYLRDNNIAELPNSISKLKTLHSIGLSNNDFKEFPIQLTNMKSLAALDLSFNEITSIPKEIAQMTGLRQLFLKDNGITDFPDEFFQLKKLKKLYISGNPITHDMKLKLTQGLPKTEIVFD